MTENLVILAVVFLGLVLEIIFAYKLRADKKRLDRIAEEFTDELQRTRNKMHDVLSRTRDEAEKILITSVEQYKAVTEDVQKLSQHTQQKLSETTEELIEWQASVMATELETQQTDLRHHALEAQQKLRSTTQHEIKELSSKLSESIVTAQKDLQTQLTQISDEVRKDLEAYSAEQKERIAQESTQLVQSVTQKYLHKELSEEQQHKIIMQLIDELEV